MLPKKCLFVASFFFLLLVGIIGCAAKNGEDFSGAVEINAVRPPPIELQVVNRRVSRKALLLALKKGELVNSPRIVEIFFRTGESDLAIPMYRLFEVHPESAYSLLGLQAADIIIAANNFVVFKQQQFRNYIRALPQQKEASIEIKRQGQSLLLKYEIVD